MRSIRRVVSLALLAILSLFALLAPAAQAENLGDGGQVGVFEVEGIGTELVAVANGTVAQENFSRLLIPARNAYIQCNGALAAVGGINESLAVLAAIFTGCKTFEEVTDMELAGCSIPGEEIEVEAFVYPKTHENESYVLLAGAHAGAVFGTIRPGAECALGFKVNVKGSVVGLVDNANEAVEHLITFSEAIQKLFQVGSQGDKLLFGNVEAFAVGSGEVGLNGEHLGVTWRVI